MICDSCEYQNDPICNKGHIPLSLEFDGKCKDYKEKIAELSNVEHPKHYNREIECIDEMLMVFGREAVMHFCLCNVWKYRYRAGDKNGQEDIEKSDWYMKKYKELKDASVQGSYNRIIGDNHSNDDRCGFCQC